MEYDNNELGLNKIYHEKVLLMYSRTNNSNVAGSTERGCNGNVAADTGRRRCNCECVYRCLYELLADALGENDPCHRFVSPIGDLNETNRRRYDCECVYRCLYELLADALGENEPPCRCPR